MANGPNTTLGVMHDILFRQLERIANQDLTGEFLGNEDRGGFGSTGRR